MAKMVGRILREFCITKLGALALRRLELVVRKYYWETLRRDIESYGCDVCLFSKVDLSMDFVTGLPISMDWKGDSYDLILVIVERPTKMVHYEPVQITIDAPAAGYTPFELNCGHRPPVSHEEDLNPRSRFKAADELANNFRNLMTACRKNLEHGLDIANPFPPTFRITCMDWTINQYRRCPVKSLIAPLVHSTS